MKCVIGGCARNIQYELYNSLKDIIKIGNTFDEYAIIIYENDSSDKTVDVIKSFQATVPRMYLFSEKDVKGSRTERLSRGRNILLECVRSYFSNYDFYMVMDLDYKQPTTFDIQHILNNWHFEWNAITAVSKYRYYDWWALRMESGLTYDCWNPNENQGGDCKYYATKFSKQMPKTVTKVISAFNGIGIYKIHALLRNRCCSYVGSKKGIDICEHVEFHKCLGNIFIHPDLVTKTWEDGIFTTRTKYIVAIILVVALIPYLLTAKGAR